MRSTGRHWLWIAVATVGCGAVDDPSVAYQPSFGDGGSGNGGLLFAGGTDSTESGGAAGADGSPSGGQDIGGSATGGSATGGSATGGSAAGAGGSQGEGGCENPFNTYDLSDLEASEVWMNYSVTGATELEIRSNINATRGGQYDAQTSWYVAWNYDDCFGSGLFVSLDISYRLPEWLPPASPDPEVVSAWDTYMDALNCHEYGHAAFGIRAALDAYQALSTIDAGGDCELQQVRASLAFDEILDGYIAEEIQYDADTNHGATQGAIFPAP
jgi:predicted secreted Zn-dependent protease